MMMLAWVFVAHAGARARKLFNQNWLFTLGDSASMSATSYKDGQWRHLSLPHDWAIEGDFSVANPSGATGGALPGGIGWYRKHFTAQLNKGERLFVEFDGVFMNATVYINGHELGTRPYGYSSFEYELTPYIRSGQDNVIAVRVDNGDQPNSRWYSGCGIYRNVWLTQTGGTRIGHWGVNVRTEADGKVQVFVEVDGSDKANLSARHTLLDAAGRSLVRKTGAVAEQTFSVKRPILWSVDKPTVYYVKTELLKNGNPIDEVTTRTAFRKVVFDAKNGFFLNGKNIKINGVCMHHDLGCLGAAYNHDAMHRQLTRMKQMGVNALRCSHNPPAPELLDMCDTLGIMVMDESFDMWRAKKTKNDYARFFDKWFERDLTDLVKRDRNHPSIILWSIGNEVLEQWNNVNTNNLTAEEANLILNAGHGKDKLGKADPNNVNQIIAQKLYQIIKSLDPTRLVTAGCNEPDPSNNIFQAEAVDVIGFNYHRQWIKDVPKNFPGKPFLMSESVSALQTRGYYVMPSDSIIVAPRVWSRNYTDPTMMCSAYDNSHAPWSSTHEETWDIVKHTPYCSGQFIWTGFDYIGEPTPYRYPARSSNFGICDLAGFPKDAYYMYQSEWTTKDVLHLFPHWNWNEGDTVDVWCYYNNADEVELLLNGRSLGTQRKTEHTYHTVWRVQYEPGEITVIARKNGKEVRRTTNRTAKAPTRIRLVNDYKGQNTVFVRAEVVDDKGNLCPWASDDITFETDNGTIIGVDNGSAFSTERFKDNHRKAFFGKALVVVQIKDAGKPVTIKAKSPMLHTAEVQF